MIKWRSIVLRFCIKKQHLMPQLEVLAVFFSFQQIYSYTVFSVSDFHSSCWTIFHINSEINLIFEDYENIKAIFMCKKNISFPRPLKFSGFQQPALLDIWRNRYWECRGHSSMCNRSTMGHVRPPVLWPDSVGKSAFLKKKKVTWPCQRMLKYVLHTMNIFV